MERRLEAVNEEERVQYKPELDAAAAELLKDVNTRVNAENAAKSKQALQAAAKFDLDKPFNEQFESIEQVIKDNLGQSAVQDKYGHDGAKALQRAREILDALLKKFAEDCRKKKAKGTDILALGRMAQLVGTETDPEVMLQGCARRQIIARGTFAGIEYEARRCLLGDENFKTMTGEWTIIASGALSGDGIVEIGPGGKGKLRIKTKVPGFDDLGIYMTGDAEVISGGGQCALKITEVVAEGRAPGGVAAAAGIGGTLPIKVLNQACK